MTSMPTICLDFDGVIHWYREGWKGEEIYDEPVPGIKETIDELRKHYYIIVCSTRTKDEEGIKRVQEWLDRYGIKVDEIVSTKPVCRVYVDDRAICFDGDTKGLIDKINNFKTWQEIEKDNKKLKEEIQTLELWLDNKEKLNEEYRVKLDKYKKYYDRDKEELMESCYALAKENDELKEEIEGLKTTLYYSGGSNPIM